MRSRLRDKSPDKRPHSMWRNFCTSIVMLMIAMTAALYSSGTARDGRVIAAAMSAFIALGIAIWVGVKFVPRLAANVDWDWLPLFSRYRVTREGWMYFGAVTVVVFAAINTANNLLYMVLSALLAVLMLSGFLSSLNFRSLRVQLRVPPHCFAMEPFPIFVRAYNEKRVFPSLSVYFDSRDNTAFRFSTFYVPVIAGQRRASLGGQAMITKRGHYKFSALKISSRYPFGFFLKDRDYTVAAECICYPEIIPQERMSVGLSEFQGANLRFERGQGHDLYIIRDYIPSDGTRHVHWKASAKTSSLKTREYAAEESRQIILAFDRFGQPGDAEKFEQLVSYTASLAYHFMNDGVVVALVSDDWRSANGNSQMLLDSILEYLALVQMTSDVSSPAVHAAGAIRLSLRG